MRNTITCLAFGLTMLIGTEARADWDCGTYTFEPVGMSACDPDYWYLSATCFADWAYHGCTNGEAYGECADITDQSERETCMAEECQSAWNQVFNDMYDWARGTCSAIDDEHELWCSGRVDPESVGIDAWANVCCSEPYIDDLPWDLYEYYCAMY